MPRKTADYPIDSPTSRAHQLPARGAANKPFWKGDGAGLALGYERDPGGGAGRWIGRRSLGEGRYATKLIGLADDLGTTGGITFDDALAQLRRLFLALPAPMIGGAVGDILPGAITAAQAIERYVNASDSEYKTEMRRTAALHVTPYIGKIALSKLTRTQVEEWRAFLVERLEERKRDAIAEGSAREETEGETARRARDSANRIMKLPRAAFNAAFDDPTNGLTSDLAWRKGMKAFRGVEKAREHHFDTHEIARLIASCPQDDADFRLLMAGGWVTGARYGELGNARVRDFNPRAMELDLDGKTGARTMQLTGDAPKFFARVCAGRPGSEFIFLHDGEPWGDGDQQRPMKRALKAAGLDEQATFYALRHSYISRAIEAGLSHQVIADQCGTSVRMIEKNYAKVIARHKRAMLERFSPAVALPEGALQLPAPDADMESLEENLAGRDESFRCPQEAA